MNKYTKLDILRVTTVSLSLKKLLSGQLAFVEENGLKVGTASLGQFNHEPHYEITALTRTINPIKDIQAIRQLIKIIRSSKPRIVHSHTPKAGMVAMIAAKWCGVEHRFHTVAGLPLMEKTGFLKFVLIQVEKLIYMSATRVLPNSYGLKDYIEENIYKGDKLSIVGHGTSNGVNTNHFNIEQLDKGEVDTLRQSLGIKPDDLVFFFIGRMVKDKGIEELVSAFEQLAKENTAYKLLLVGPLEPELDPIHPDTLQAIENHAQIVSVGYVEDVRPYISIGHVLTFPSYREGFPNVPMQAACFEKALILTNINGCNELVKDQEHGFLIPVKSEEALLKAMKTYAGDANLRKAHGARVKQRVEENFSQQYVWGEILKLYEETKR